MKRRTLAELSPQLWVRLEPLLDRALEEPESSRDEWARRATEHAPELTLPLLELVAECAEAEGFLDALAPARRFLGAEGQMPWTKSRVEQRLGQRIGPHRLVGILGHGGMGVVYLGRRDDGLFEQEVAIKVADHRLGTEGLERFQWERRILAGLEHPSIARLLDGGTLEDGSPYLVMERVEGEPLDRYGEGIPLAERIELAMDICRALDFAHRRRVVHLDLKPSNILVTKQGAVKLLDFGIAQLLSEDGAGTSSAIAGLTPAFAAPERWRGEAVTSSSDLYSLGVVLHVLITGRAELDAGPTRAGADRELAAIVGKLLASQPEDRYESAASVATDLHRWRHGLPVLAVDGGWTYPLQKHLIRHHRTWALAAILAVAASWLGVSWWQDRQRNQRQLALVADFSRQAERAESFLRYIYALPAHDVTREKALAEARLQEIESRMEQLGEIALGPGHFALGRGWSSLGQPQRALKHLEEAWQRGPRSPELAFALGHSLGEIYAEHRGRLRGVADAELRAQLLATSQARYRDRALELLTQARGPSETTSRHYLEGLIAFYDGELETALEAAHRASTETPWLPDGLALAGEILTCDGEEKMDAGAHGPATERFERARGFLAEARRLAPSDPNLAESACVVELRTLDLERQRRSAVGEGLELARERCLGALELDPSRVGPRQMLATFEVLRGRSLRLTVAERQAAIERALKILEQAPGSTHEDPDLARVHAMALLGRALLALATGDEAGPDLDLAITLFERSLALDPTQLLARMNLATTLAVRAQTAADTDGAEEDYERSATAFEEALEYAPESTLLLYNLASQHYTRGLWLDRHGRPPQAAFTEALDIAQEVLDRNDSLPHALNLHGAVLERLIYTSLEDKPLEDMRLAEGNGVEERQQRLATALVSLDRAIEIDPRYPPAWHTRGALLSAWARSLDLAQDRPAARDKIEEALSSFDQAEQLIGHRTELLLRNRADGHLLAAEIDRRLGADATPSLRLAARALDEAQRSFPSGDWQALEMRLEALTGELEN